VTGSELRALRRSVNASQSKLAEIIGISPSALSQAETGRTKLTKEHEALVVEKIARIKAAQQRVSEAGRGFCE